ncbi:hypothetical protein M9H77_22220 [Catharanthus roseus]|uniref:Uncharacterized protein n=1 Tax=Catharanthus roseus TaxID=4058 RepID=A0ACC0ASE3_CATRO|nr:hypothetical protein M9H77_22220 [Catharanthus roseus]
MLENCKENFFFPSAVETPEALRGRSRGGSGCGIPNSSLAHYGRMGAVALSSLATHRWVTATSSSLIDTAWERSTARGDRRSAANLDGINEPQGVAASIQVDSSVGILGLGSSLNEKKNFSADFSGEAQQAPKTAQQPGHLAGVSTHIGLRMNLTATFFFKFWSGPIFVSCCGPHGACPFASWRGLTNSSPSPEAMAHVEAGSLVRQRIDFRVMNIVEANNILRTHNRFTLLHSFSIMFQLWDQFRGLSCGAIAGISIRIVGLLFAGCLYKTNLPKEEGLEN